MSSRLVREMSITHKEFFRLLPKAVNNAPISRPDDQVIITTNAGRVNITLSTETTRKIGMLELPVTKVTLEFNDLTPTAGAAFLTRFDLAFQKGGG